MMVIELFGYFFLRRKTWKNKKKELYALRKEREKKLKKLKKAIDDRNKKLFTKQV